VRVAVLSGGPSSEHDVSQASAASVRAGLAEGGHDVVAIDIGRDRVWRRDGEALTVTPGGGLEGADVAFPVLHGPYGEDGTVQGMLEVLGVPYVGAGVLASAVCMDKLLFKDLLARAGVPQVDYETPGDGVLDRLGLPVFVKPSRMGSSFGIHKVERAEDLDAAVADARTYDSRVIVEALAPGIEVECSVLGNADPQASPPGEIVVNADWYDFEAKYTPGGMDLVVPARISVAATARVRELAVAVFGLVAGRGLARVDFFVDGDAVLVNELNTMPGFTETSVYGKLWAADGLPYPKLLERLVGLAFDS
jgi:D-alanine-D-alanine ligase